MRRADEERFREFAREQAVPLRRYAYLLCRDWHTAEDLVQTTLVKMYGAWPRLARDAWPVNYARTTLTRSWLDERRRPWRRAEDVTDSLPDVADPTASPAQRQHRDSVRAELFQALSLVAPRQRAVLALRFVVGLSVEETARELGCTAGTVKSQTARGLVALRTVLANHKVDIGQDDMALLTECEVR